MIPEASEDSTLEGNVERLLKAADAPPKMNPTARARVLDSLLAAQAQRSAPLAPRPVDHGRRSPALRAMLPKTTRGRVLGASGALAAAALVGFLVTRPAAQPSAVAYENAGSGPKVVTLRDGSLATLDVGASIIERAVGDVRLVRGQVIFDVRAAHEPATAIARFAVHTDAGTALSVGSRFLVKAAASSVEVFVAKGVVEVLGDKGARAEIRAGEEGVLSGDAPPEAKSAPRISHVFDFARKTEGDDLAPPATRTGTLVGRDPRWQKEAPLELRDFTVDVHVEGGFARTTIDQTFFNPKPRQLEGIYSFPMPRGAAISRLAMYVDGELVESGIVDRARGRDIYEGIVEQRRDPALLEWMSGNTFRMRIFPIPGRTDKRIFMSYTQPLEHLYGSDRLVVPIPTVDQAAAHAKFSVKVVGGSRFAISSPSHPLQVASQGDDSVLSFEAADAVLGQDLVVTMQAKADDAEPSPVVRTFEDPERRYLLARTSPDLRALAHARSARTERPKRRIAVLFDVSASRSQEALAMQARFVDGLIDAFDETDEIAFVTVGHDARVMPGGLVPARAVERANVSAFLASESEGIGDTRLDLGLAAAAAALGDGDHDREVIYVGDGFFVGQGVTPEKGSVASRLAAELSGRARFIGVGIGDSIDRSTLETLANLTNGMAIEVGEGEDLAHRAFDLIATTYTPCLAGLRAEVLDANGRPIESALASVTATRVCDGERVEVVARVAKPAVAARVRVRGRVASGSPGVDGEPWEASIDVSKSDGTAAYLPRVFAERRVAALLADEPPGPGRAESPNAVEITALAKQYFLVTPFTSLLVLENDAMYKQYGVEKKKPEGWALYSAPSSVKVSYEPLGTGTLSDGGNWDLLERSPTRLFYANASRAESRLQLGLIGAIGFGGPVSRGRLGGPGTGEGFGSGSGRLSGAHRAKPDTDLRYKLTTTDSLRADPVLLRQAFRSEIDNGELAIQTVSARPSAMDPGATRWADRGSEDVDLDWLELAFQGGGLAAFQYESDPRLADLTEFVPAMFALPVDRAADYLHALGPAKQPRDPAALELLDKGRGKTTGTFMTDTGKTLAFAADGSVSQTATLQMGVLQIERASREGLTHAYPELALRTQRAAGPELVWWLSEQAPMVAPLSAWTEGLRVELVGSDTVRIRAPESAGYPGAPPLPDLELTFDGDGRVTKLVRGTASARQELTFSREGDDWLIARAAQRPLRWKAQASAVQPEPAYTDVVLPLANPNRWLDRIKEPGFQPDGGFARRQLLASYAAMSDLAGLRRELSALATEQGGLSRGDLVLASRAIASSAETSKLLTRLPKDDRVRRYLEASAAAEPSRPKAFDQLGAEGKGTLIGALGSYRSMLIDSQRGTPSAGFEKRVRAFVVEYPSARFFQYAAVRVAADRLGWQDSKRAAGLWELLTSDAALGPIADRQIATLWRGYGGAAEPGAKSAARAIEAAFARGYAFDLDWQLKNAIVGSNGQVALDLLLSKWRGRIQRSGTGAQVLSFVRASVDPYGERLTGDVGGVLRRLAEIEVDPDTRVRIAVVLLAAGQFPEAKRVMEPLLRAGAASPLALELSVSIAERSGDIEGAAALLDRLLRETEEQSLDLNTVRGWYSHLMELHVRKARSSADLDASLKAALEVASRWRREDGANPAIDELCATALFRSGRDADARRYLSSIVERRPAEGGSWARVGQLLQGEGDLDGALASFSQAALVEPTNPTWDLQRAEVLMVREGPDDAREAERILNRIVKTGAQKDGYQDRFARVVSDAQRLSSMLSSAK